MLESTGGMLPNPPSRLAGLSGSSSKQLTPVESFKRSIKRYSMQFNNFKEGKHWDTLRRNTLVTTRAQDVKNVLYLHCIPLTEEDVNSFDEK